jgi:fucose permease
MAGMSPGIAISASDFIRGNGVSSGMLFSAGCIGSAVMPFVVGIIVDYSDIKMGFVFVLAMMVIALIASIANVRDRNYC